MVLDFELIRSKEAMLTLSQKWSELAAHQLRPSPFIDTNWLFAWWDHFGEDRELAIGLFRVSGSIVGIAPLCRRKQNYYGFLPFSRLEFLGAGYGPGDVWSEYLGLIAAPNLEAAVAQSFVDNLYAGSFGGWDECLLDMMDGEAPVLNHIRSAIVKRIGKCPEETIDDAWYIPLKSHWSAYLDSLPSNYRKQMRRDLRNFESWVGERGYRLNKVTGSASLEIGFEILCRLHNERWSAEQSDGAFSSHRFLDFHRDYANRALRKEELELYWLTVGDVPVAAEYAISYGKNLYLYQCGRSADVPDGIRIGHVSMMLVISEAIKRGFREVDFMGGDQPYKRRYTRVSRPLVSVRLVQSGAKEPLRKLANELKKAGKKLIEVAPKSQTGLAAIRPL